MRDHQLKMQCFNRPEQGAGSLNVWGKKWFSFLNMNQFGFCTKSSIADYPITSIYVSRLAEGSSLNQRQAIGLETNLKSGRVFTDFQRGFILFTLSD